MPNTSRILVLGLGTSGLAAAELALQARATVTVLDAADTPVLRERAQSLRSRGASVCLEWNGTPAPGPADLAVISPGVPAGSPMGRLPAQVGCPVVSELEYGFLNCSCPILAVTGTNGKTTTTEMTTHCLRQSGLRAVAAGNIGLPLCDVARRSSSLDFLVVEVSSFQLDCAQRFEPLAAALLNVTPDHLDRYPDMDAYTRSKARLFANMRRADHVVLREDLLAWPAIHHALPGDGSRPVTFWGAASDTATCFVNDAGALCWRREDGLAELARRSQFRMRGRHNLENILAAAALCRFAGVSPETACRHLEGFAPSPHRLELVAVHRNIRYVNDSKATNPDALIRSLETVAEETGGKVLLIAGGVDKGLEFSSVVPWLRQHVREVFLIGRCRERLAKQWGAVVSCKLFTSFGGAVEAAAEAAVAGDTVLLAPGCASQDMFKDYAERGRAFCEFVRRRAGE